MNSWKYIGLLSSLLAIGMYFIFLFANPYSSVPANHTTIERMGLFLLAPACAALLGTLRKSHVLLLIAFFWAFPLSLYLVNFPSIFMLFFVSCMGYLIAGIRLRNRHGALKRNDEESDHVDEIIK
ncbi:hypothetical protein A8990_10740 [Paenibacillus taihuensis]|uniref:Uncharacterized protein n=1 Tax=Paenibacillus taihuensis TaxID=1156355 RepID=A0A3D9S7E6_9BACL|nr:hypothetical protein A8990_10740 [Paenibacillus taihuensis]